MTTNDKHAHARERLDQHARDVKARLEAFKRNHPSEKLNELQTRTFFIDTFIRRVLRYSLLDADDVLVEVVVDRGGAVAKTVDYAIHGKYILVEAKPADNPLGEDAVKQIRDAVAGCSPARFGLLTNGINFKWFRCPQKEIIPESRPFLEHTLDDPPNEVCEWVAAVSKYSINRDSLERLAWRMSLETDIMRWLGMTFVSPEPKQAVVLRKAAELSVPLNHIDLVQEAAKAVWLRLQSAPPPPPKLNYVELKGESLELGNGLVLDAKKLKRAWRSGGGEWHVEANATRLTNSVLSLLLKHDARRDNEVALADLHKLIEYSETNPKGYVDKIPDFNNLYWDKNVNNDAKEDLLESVAGQLQFDPPAESPLATSGTLEVWLVSGPKKD